MFSNITYSESVKYKLLKSRWLQSMYTSMSKLDDSIELCRRQQAALLPHDGDVEEDESDAGDDDVEEAVQEEDVQARVDVGVSEAALMEYLVAVCVKCTVTEFYWQR